MTTDIASDKTAQEYVEIYHILVRGMEMIGIFMNSAEDARKSSAGKQLERAYVLLRRDYLKIRGKHPELGDIKNSVLSVIPRLGGAYTAEYILSWAEGSMEPDENGEFPEHRYGGKHSFEDELAYISEKAYLLGVEDIEKEPKNMASKQSYDLAYEAIKGMKARNINEYTLNWDEITGEVLVNGTYKLKNTYNNSGSNTAALMKKINEIRNANKGNGDIEFDFEPNGRRTTAQILTDLGITPILRKVFFPKGTRGNHIRFRSPVKRRLLEIEGLDLEKLYKEVDLKIIESQIRKEEGKIRN